MATLDDKLMGEKLHYYCSSSSESEGEDEDGEKFTAPAEPAAPNGNCQWDGTSCNVTRHFIKIRMQLFINIFHFQTGPKGVIKDYQCFKQLESEKREEQKEELAKLAKKFSITCRTNVRFKNRISFPKKSLLC
jgi:hypothetical protein